MSGWKSIPLWGRILIIIAIIVVVVGIIIWAIYSEKTRPEYYPPVQSPAPKQLYLTMIGPGFSSSFPKNPWDIA